MSHYMTALAMRQTGLKPAAKIVLYWLADHHNSETGLCCPSLRTLASECEMDVATVKRHLSALEGAGLISRQQRTRENGSQTSTQYALHMPEPPAQNAPPPSAKCATPLAQKHTPHNLGIYNLGNEQEDISCDGGFDDFWAAYPRKTVKSAARKAYAKAVKKARHEEIMFGLSRHLPALQAKEQQFIPHPATWLNQERWSDEPEQPDNNIQRRAVAGGEISAGRGRGGGIAAAVARRQLSGGS